MQFKEMEKIADLFMINLLFILCSLPVITIGASATAMHHTLRRWREEKGSISADFFRAFRMNCRQATVLWLAFLALSAVMLANFWIVSSWTGPPYSIVMVMLFVVSAVMLAWISLCFPFLARFDNTTVQIAKNSLLIALVCPVRTLIAVILNLIPVALAVLIPGVFLIGSVLWLVILCSVSGLFIQLLFAPVFDRIGFANPECNS